MDYKATLNLPKTDFPMKGNLPESEPKVLERWERQRLYDEIQKRRPGASSYLLHDGPPYANGDIHMGHALNKGLKDIIVRYQTMQGKLVPFVPGWDCHGLPIEYQLMKELNVTKHQVGRVEFRRKARAYALKYVSIQRDEFKRLGCLGDWENPYLTLEPGYVATTLRSLKELVEKDFIYRARRPVNWCPTCETALAEAEVEYELFRSPSIYVKFELEESDAHRILPPGLRVKKVFLVIWTTTPWTLMGNVAVAVHPSFEYGIRQAPQGEGWLLLADLSEPVCRDLGIEKTGPILKKFLGSELKGLRYRHPLGLPKGTVVLAEHVLKEEGTGLVHTAPGFGAEDYATGRKYGLEIFAPVDSQGRFSGLPDPVARFNGIQVQEANPGILELLKSSQALLKSGHLEHEYPHCWRCHTPIIFRATDQWFFNVDQGDFRQRLLDRIAREVRWIPPEGKERITGMVRVRPDWCLSRQRLWGIPIPAVKCTPCEEVLLDPRIIENFAQAIERDPEGSDRWFLEPAERWVPSDFRCPRCQGREFEPTTDILDVWFDSGVSHQAVLTRRKGLYFPAELYLEGSDQHRGWFQVSLITSVALRDKAPYQAVLTHGFVVDGEGRKMSKSLGNVISPEEVISSYGADVLRLWVASSDYREDVRLSPKILAQVAEVYRKIRNTLRFCLANVSDLDPKDQIPFSQMEELDRWVLGRLRNLLTEVTKGYQEYAFHRVVKSVHEFCTVTLSNFYLDVIKDRLYTLLPRDPKRRSAQTALVRLAETLLLVLAPLLPMTTEEAWGHLKKDSESIHLKGWPDPVDLPKDTALEEDFQRLLKVRDQAMKALEEARQKGAIGDPLEAQLTLICREESLRRFLEEKKEELATACIVSGLQVTKSTPSSGSEPLDIQVLRAPGEKCLRCWMYHPSVGKSPQHPGLCQRCQEVLKALTAR